MIPNNTWSKRFFTCNDQVRPSCDSIPSCKEWLAWQTWIAECWNKYYWMMNMLTWMEIYRLLSRTKTCCCCCRRRRRRVDGSRKKELCAYLKNKVEKKEKEEEEREERRHRQRIYHWMIQTLTHTEKPVSIILCVPLKQCVWYLHRVLFELQTFFFRRFVFVTCLRSIILGSSKATFLFSRFSLTNCVHSAWKWISYLLNGLF